MNTIMPWAGPNAKISSEEIVWDSANDNQPMEKRSNNPFNSWLVNLVSQNKTRMINCAYTVVRSLNSLHAEKQYFRNKKKL